MYPRNSVSPRMLLLVLVREFEFCRDEILNLFAKIKLNEILNLFAKIKLNEILNLFAKIKLKKGSTAESA